MGVYTRDFSDFFDRAQALTTTPGFNGWTSKITGTTPTLLCVSGRGLQMSLTATSEAQIATAYFNDVLPWKLSELQRLDIHAKVSGIDAVTTAVWGVGSAQNGTLDSMTYNSWFRMEGSASTSNVVAESDDNGTEDNNDVATGVTLSSTYKLFTFDFTRINDVRYWVDGVRVATGTTFNLSAASAQNVQPFFQLQKASGTGTPSITIGRIFARLRMVY